MLLAGVTFTVNLFSLEAPSFLRISLMLYQEDIFLRVIPFCNNFVQLFSRKDDKVMSLSLMLRGVVYISDHRHTGRCICGKHLIGGHASFCCQPIQPRTTNNKREAAGSCGLLRTTVEIRNNIIVPQNKKRARTFLYNKRYVGNFIEFSRVLLCLQLMMRKMRNASVYTIILFF